MMSTMHCELRDSVKHLKVERILFFRFILERMFSQCLHCVSDVCVFACAFDCWCVCVCVCWLVFAW